MYAYRILIKSGTSCNAYERVVSDFENFTALYVGVVPFLLLQFSKSLKERLKTV